MTRQRKDQQNPHDAPVRVRTLADLARLAGVSTGTVSRALAGKSLVNGRTRERIQALADEHGFRPNQMASKLRSRHTGVISIAVPPAGDRRQHISNPFLMTLIGHLADELAQSGYDVMLSRVLPQEREDWLDRITGSGMVDGVILIGQSDQLPAIERIARTYRPLVVWGDNDPARVHCAVGSDNLLGGRMAARHLLACGARRMVFLGDTAGAEIARRLEGCRQELAGVAGATLEHASVSLSGQGTAAQVHAALAGRTGAIDGIFAASDLVAMTALRELHALGCAVPGAVQVVGFDDLPLAAQTVPPLTTIRQDIEGAARAMVERLKARIALEPAESLMMMPRLVVRGTTLPQPGEAAISSGS